MVTCLVAWLFLSNLDTHKRLGPFSLNACQWPGFANLVGEETNLLASAPGASNAELISSSKPRLQSKVIHGILVLTTYVFVACNTLVFLLENLIAFSRVKHWLLYVAWGLTFWVWLVVVFWIPKVYYHWDAQWIGEFPDEEVAFGIFMVFFIVDVINWRVYARGDAKHDAIDSRFALRQAAFVDFPVIAGVSISIVLASHLNQHFKGSDQYLFGFFSGATVMHLATSQIIYTILAVRRDVLKRKELSC